MGVGFWEFVLVFYNFFVLFVLLSVSNEVGRFSEGGSETVRIWFGSELVFEVFW